MLVTTCLTLLCLLEQIYHRATYVWRFYASLPGGLHIIVTSRKHTVCDWRGASASDHVLLRLLLL